MSKESSSINSYMLDLYLLILKSTDHLGKQRLLGHHWTAGFNHKREFFSKEKKRTGFQSKILVFSPVIDWLLYLHPLQLLRIFPSNMASGSTLKKECSFRPWEFCSSSCLLMILVGKHTFVPNEVEKGLLNPVALPFQVSTSAKKALKRAKFINLWYVLYCADSGSLTATPYVH